MIDNNINTLDSILRDKIIFKISTFMKILSILVLLMMFSFGIYSIISSAIQLWLSIAFLILTIVLVMWSFSITLIIDFSGITYNTLFSEKSLLWSEIDSIQQDISYGQNTQINVFIKTNSSLKKDISFGRYYFKKKDLIKMIQIILIKNQSVLLDKTITNLIKK